MKIVLSVWCHVWRAKASVHHLKPSACTPGNTTTVRQWDLLLPAVLTELAATDLKKINQQTNQAEQVKLWPHSHDQIFRLIRRSTSKHKNRKSAGEERFQALNWLAKVQLPKTKHRGFQFSQATCFRNKSSFILRIFYCSFGSLDECSTEKPFPLQESATQQGHVTSPLTWSEAGGGEIHLEIIFVSH